MTGDLNKAKTPIVSQMAGIGVLAGRAFAAAFATAAVFAPIGIFAGILKSGEEFNRRMRNSLAIMGDLSDAMREDMAQAALKAASVTQFSAKQAAEAFFFLASAGLSAKQSILALPKVAQFAQAGQFDLAAATSLAANAQSALGLKLKDPIRNMESMVRVTDVLVKANTLADATTRQFSEAITTKAGAAARIAGKDIEELSAILAVLADQGVKGAEAGTALNIVFRDLQTKFLRNRQIFKRLGVDVFNANTGAMENMADIIGDLEKALAGMGAEQKKTTLLQMGFQDRSVVFIQLLIGMSHKIREWEKALRNAGGTTKEVADKQLTPLQKGMAKLGSAFTEISSDFMKWAGPILGRAMTRFAGWFKFIRAGFILFGQLVKSVAGIFMDVFRIAFDFVGGLLAPFQNEISGAFSNILELLNIMLGSWEGLRQGIILITIQTGFAFQVAWEKIFNWFDIKVIGMVAFFKTAWSKVTEEIVRNVTPALTRLFIKFENLRRILVGKPLISVEEQEMAIKTTVADVLGELAADRVKIEEETNKKLESLRKIHEKRIAGIVEESKKASKRFEREIGDLPRLVDKFRDVMKKVKEAREAAQLPDFEVPGGVGAGGGIGGEGIGAGRAGFGEMGKRIQDAILKREDTQKKMLAQNIEQNRQLIALNTGQKELIRKTGTGVLV